jgi:hypothetical protein
MHTKLAFAGLLFAWAVAAPVQAGDVFSFSTGSPDGLMATASRPSSAGKIEIETGDDFILGAQTKLTSATFTGLLPVGAPLSDVTDVRVEIYRVFPLDSGPFNNLVPTRANSPSDVEFADRSASAGSLSFTPVITQNMFTALNSVLNGIHPSPNFHTGGEGAVTGEEVQFNVTFSTPFNLPADHYFFVPQVQLSNGDFFWLSAPKPITSGTPFLPDLQTWIRNEDLAPNWLRVATDIVGLPPPTAFNAAFTLNGQIVPEPSSVILWSISGLATFGFARFRKRPAIA